MSKPDKLLSMNPNQDMSFGKAVSVIFGCMVVLGFAVGTGVAVGKLTVKGLCAIFGGC